MDSQVAEMNTNNSYEMEDPEYDDSAQELSEHFFKDIGGSSSETKKGNKNQISTKTLPMGSIVYERTETGEIVASIVRNGERITNKKSHQQNSDVAIVRANKTKDKKGPKLNNNNDNNGEEMPACPINEGNVENVLDRTLLVTESLQQLLNSFKDDLKRMGGISDVTSNSYQQFDPLQQEANPSNARKRKEIASKVTNAYVNYQQAIDDIGELGKNPMAAFRGESWMASREGSTTTTTMMMMTGGRVAGRDDGCDDDISARKKCQAFGDDDYYDDDEEGEEEGRDYFSSTIPSGRADAYSRVGKARKGGSRGGLGGYVGGGRGWGGKTVAGRIYGEANDEGLANSNNNNTISAAKGIGKKWSGGKTTNSRTTTNRHTSEVYNSSYDDGGCGYDDDDDRFCNENSSDGAEDRSKGGMSGDNDPSGTNVSDDLWMSCEPGSDDEFLYNVGFPKYDRKQIIISAKAK